MATLNVARPTATLPVAGTAPLAPGLPTLPSEGPAAYSDAAKGAAYRQKAMPDVAAPPRRRPGFAADPRPRLRYRVAFEKLGDARFLSHRNTMDAFERAVRAAGMPAAYSEGFNPRMRLSMGPALALGLESRGEVLDLETTGALPEDAAAKISDRLPPGVRVLAVRALAPGEPSLSKSIRGAAYSMRLAPALRIRAREAAAQEACALPPALRSIAVDDDGERIRFEVNLDASAGETATPRKIVERLFALTPEEIVALPITREATVLAG
jgi:radical SAM-linked protein